MLLRQGKLYHINYAPTVGKTNKLNLTSLSYFMNYFCLNLNISNCVPNNLADFDKEINNFESSVLMNLEYSYCIRGPLHPIFTLF